MKYFNIDKEAVTKAYNNYKQMIIWFNDYYQSRGIKPEDINNETYFMDTEEVKNYCINNIGYGEISKEEFFNQCDEQLENLKKDRFGALNKYYNEVENFNYNKKDYKTENDCFKLISRCRLNKLDNSFLVMNPDFKKDRYENNLFQSRKLDMITSFNSQFLNQGIKEISDTIGGINLNSFKDEPYPDYSSHIDKEFVEMKMNKSIIEYGIGKVDHISIEIPDNVYYVDKFNSKETVDQEKINYYQNENHQIENDTTFLESIGDMVNNIDSTSKGLLKGIDNYENIYIDGEPLVNIAGKRRDNSPKEIYKYQKALLDGIKSGKPIEIVRSYKDYDVKSKQKVLRTEIVPIEFKCSEKYCDELKKEYKGKNYTWIRRTFFDWGPFKIKDENPLEVGYTNISKNKKSRHNKILADRNSRILDRYNNLNPENQLGKGSAKKFEILAIYDDKEYNDISTINFQNEKISELKEIEKESSIVHHEGAHNNQNKTLLDVSEFEKKKSIKQSIKLLGDFLEYDYFKINNIIGDYNKSYNDLLIEHQKLINEKENLPKEKLDELNQKWKDKHKEIRVDNFILRNHATVESAIEKFKEEVASNMRSTRYTGIDDADIVEENKIKEMHEREMEEYAKNYLDAVESSAKRDEEITKKVEFSTSEKGIVQQNMKIAKENLMNQMRLNNPNANASILEAKFKLVHRNFEGINFEDNAEVNNVDMYKEMADIADKRDVVKSLILKVKPDIDKVQLFDVINEIGYSREVLDNEIKNMKEAIKQHLMGDLIDIPDVDVDQDLSFDGRKREGLGLIDIDKSYNKNEELKNIDELTESIIKK